MKKILFFVSFLIVGQYAFSQQQSVDDLSEGQVNEFYQRARESGMSEMQMEQAALKQGYTLTDIVKMRKRLGENKVKAVVSKEGSDTTSVRAQTGEKGSQVSNKISTKPSLIFGSEFFDKPSITFEPNLRIATPKNYVLGPDDELIVEVYGAAINNYKLKVSTEGTVKVRELAPIYVSGLTVEEARDRVISRLRSMYAGLNAGGGTSATVTLGNIRSIKVIVTGQAKKPGVYTVSSLATAFNALVLSGGPSDNGSMRNISIIRDSKVIRTVDFYDFLLNSDQKSNVLLQDQDIIHIPYYSIRARLIGEVKRPAIYELKPKETLKDLLGFAGNFTDIAYKSTVILERLTNKERRIVNISQDQFGEFIPQSGDSYEVSAILDRYENKVEISGAVYRAGKFALDEQLKTFKNLLSKAEGLREDALRHRVVIQRERENLEPEIISIDAEKILSGEATDIELKRNDKIIVSSVKDIRENYFVSILGEINKPQDVPYADNMTVSDLVLTSGGFTDGAISSRIEIARRIRDNNQNNVNEDYNVEIISLKIDKQLHLTPNDALFKLQPFDVVYIRKSLRYETQKNATIIGEVNYPGSYSIVGNNERISDLIERAGSIKKTSYLPGAFLQRKGERIAIDIEKIIANNKINGNLLLEDNDSLYIPKRLEVVRISGAVLNPSIINFENGFSFKDYLSQAGGFMDNAKRAKPYITYANGYTQRTKNYLIFRKYPKVEPGSEIVVPLRDKKENKADYTPVLMTLATTLMVILLNKNL